MADTISAHQPEAEGNDPSHSDLARRGNTVTCAICQAVYAPAQVYEYLVQAPRMALESAFMSMCHFCFRCRRPACPNCWDHVHGVCGACALEARLPFRISSTPLQGVIFPPLRQTHLRQRQASQTRLICINPGKFQSITPIDAAETGLIQTASPKNTSHNLPMPPPLLEAEDARQLPSQASPPPETRATRSSAIINIDEINTRPEPPTDEIATKPGPSKNHRSNAIAPNPPRRTHIHIDEIATNPQRYPRTSVDEIATRPELHKGRSRLIERILVLLLLTLLLFAALLIALAELFQSANSLILQLIHIDIRAEVAYILLLIKQAFF